MPNYAKFLKDILSKKMRFAEETVVNLTATCMMPLPIVKRLSLGELTPTNMTLQMADRTMAQPEGVLEDIVIKVGKFIFPMDFVVMDMEKDTQVPLLLGRPFLATGVALIDVKK